MMKAFLTVLLCFVVCSPVLGCASVSPCALAYEKAGECPECSAAEIEARVAAVDVDCKHLVLPSGSVSK
jgi:hypothetical protein